MERLAGFGLGFTIVLLIGYFIFLAWIGSRGSTHSRSMNGFATARGKVSPWLVGLSFASTYASANLFIGVPGLAYTYGTPVLWYTLGCFGVSWVGLLVFAKTFWRYGKKFGRVSTLPEWLGKRYNSKTLQVMVSVLILFNIFYIVGQNVGLATIFEALLGIPYFWGVVIGVAITVLYVGMGGAYAQLVTDGIQAILMVITAILIFVSLFWTIGGGFNLFGVFADKLAAIDPQLVSALSPGGPYNSVFAIATIQFLLFSFVVMPHLLNKILSLETEEELRPFTLSSGLTLFFISTFIVLGGLATRVLVPGLESADKAIPVYLMEAFPPVLVAIMIVGIISAILSSTDSLYLGITSSIGNDLYKTIRPLFARGQTLSEEKLDRQSVSVAKGSLWVVGLLAFYFSIDRPESLGMLIQFSFSAIISGVIAPISLAYFWKKANHLGAIASTLSGVICFLVLTNLEVNIYISLFLGSIISLLIMVTVSLITYQEKASNYAESKAG